MGEIREDTRAGADALARKQRRSSRTLGPTEATVTALQRSAGNRAVAGLMTAERPRGGERSLARKKLTISTNFLTAAGGASAAVNPIAAALKRYNIEQSRSTRVQRLDLLWALDQAIYTFYGGLGQTDLQGTAVDAVGALLEESENEYADIVDGLNPNTLPFDTTGWTPGAVAGATALWSSIAANRGRILVAGTTGYKRRTLANLAKIMRTPTGRRLLAYLNAGKASQDVGKRVMISDVLPPELATSGLDLNKKSYARGLRERVRTAKDEAQDVKHTTKKPRFAKKSSYQAVQGPFSFNNVGPTGLEEAIWSGKAGISVAGQGYYTFGKGATGAFVHTIRSWDIEQDIPNLQGHVSYTPEFITLAHELGHAMHHLAGATTGQTTLDAVLRPAGSTSAQWSNAEEVFTIMGIDNPIREEAGLDYRATHATLPGGLKTQMKQQLTLRYNTRINALYGALEGADKKTLTDWMTATFAPATQGDRPAILFPETQQEFDEFLADLEEKLAADDDSDVLVSDSDSVTA
jgi:hypothetical protein